MDHSGNISDWLLLGQVVGYTAGTLIVLLLSVLVRRASRFEDPSAYGLLLWSILLWNAGNLVASVAVLVGADGRGALLRVTMAAAYTGAALSPAGALMMWQRLGRRSSVGTWLVTVSFVAGVTLTLLMSASVVLTRPPVPEKPLWSTLAYHVTIFFALGALVFYRRHATVPAARVAIGMAGLGALGIGLTVVFQKMPMVMAPAAVVDPNGFGAALFDVVRQVSTHIMTLGALLFFARFRFADVFIRQSLRIIAAALLGVLCAMVLSSPRLSVAGLAGARASAATLTVGALLVGALLLSFALVDRLVVALVDRRLFRQPDYAAALGRLRDELAEQRDREILHAATTRLVRDTLTLQEADIVSSVLSSVSPPTVPTDGLAGGLRVPIGTSDSAGDVLEVTPRWDHPTLLAREVDFLRASAEALSQRLDVVRREDEEIERRTHEADLRRQVSEATLRALQAQVNPHFLFNTLNTIAQLIQDDPASAEAMTLRLAEVFSHVLTSGHRPFSSVRDEMAFLRTYLTIEEARFGDRLRVAFVVDPAAVHAVIPSLILQPAVENALKHGLSRKIGPGHLTISAFVEGTDLRLSVEDDGAGPNGAGPSRSPSNGVGLRNISERLQTIYADRAGLCFEAGPRGGSVLTVRLPLHHHDQEPAG